MGEFDSSSFIIHGSLKYCGYRTRLSRTAVVWLYPRKWPASTTFPGGRGARPPTVHPRPTRRVGIAVPDRHRGPGRRPARIPTAAPDPVLLDHAVTTIGRRTSAGGDPVISVGTPEKRVDGENKMAGGNGGLPGSPEVTVHDFVDRVLGKPPLPPSAHGRKAVERSDRRSGARQDRPVSRDRAERAVRRRSVNPGQGRCRALARLRFAGRPGTGAAPRRG